MLSGIDAFNNVFLAGLNATENRITKVNQQITSGLRVNEASDDPSAIASILDYQQQIHLLTQTQTNLNSAATDASSADQALQSASSILDQAVSIATQGASGTSDASTRAGLGERVKALEQQLVAIANTTVNGRYIFGGDDPTTQPYTFDWSKPNGIVQSNTAGSTIMLRDASGNSIVPGQTAQQIFDARDALNAPAPNNVFAAMYGLGQALLNNDQAGTATALTSLKAAVSQVQQATVTNGNTETWIQQANESASQKLTDIQQALSAVRDVDIPAAATELTMSQTALQASLAAHGALNTKSLFSYLG